jgi:hypothetical protein
MSNSISCEERSHVSIPGVCTAPTTKQQLRNLLPQVQILLTFPLYQVNFGSLLKENSPVLLVS